MFNFLSNNSGLARYESDVRHDDEIGHEIVRFITTHGVLSAVMTDRIIGCPHKEGIDILTGKLVLSVRTGGPRSLDRRDNQLI